MNSKDHELVELVEFDPVYFAEYQSWFVDAELEQALGPAPDQEWLSHIQNEETGCQFAGISDEKLVAVVGVALPVSDSQYSVITDIAIRPDLRRTGVGTQILRALIVKQEMLGDDLRAYVESSNVNAKRFFERNGWTTECETPDADGMFELRYRE